MSSSEDCADHEFVFVASKRAAVAAYDDGAAGTRQRRLHPRLNQPIPTTCDLMPHLNQPIPTTCDLAPTPPPSTTARAKATPLPPELIDLLPPHLRHNTVPDYCSSARPPPEDRPPERPPLPSTYCSGDYSNLEDPSSCHYSVEGVTLGQGRGRAAWLSPTRPSVPLAANGATASHTAPTASLLTDSATSRSRSLPREASRTYLSGRPRQPPTPKFARSPTRSGGWTAGEPRSSYTAVLAGDGERVSTVRCVEPVAPTPSHVFTNLRATMGGNVGGSANTEAGPYIATGHTTMGQSRSSPPPRLMSTVSPTPRRTPTSHTNYRPAHGGSLEREQSVAATPPSSPEMRRAWNVVGVPVRRSPARGSPSPARPASHDDNIYDNLVVGPGPLAAPRTSITPPAAAAVARRVTRDPRPLTGKPPSPPTLRRASRSPSPGAAAGWTPPYCPAQGGTWVPVWGSSPHLLQAGGSAVYVYSGGPRPVVCEGRSLSCDRLPTGRPSPPPSPRSGRRSASPCPLPAHRHSPSPDRGRPPRPRRPPLRKAKTVEVGCLGLVIPQPQPVLAPQATARLAYLPRASSPLAPATDAYFIQPADHHSVPTYHKHCYSRQQHRLPNIETIPEQCGKPGEDYVEGGRSWPCAGPPATPSLPVACTSSPSPQPSPACVKQEQADGTKQKVTYKSSFYKCMKNLLRPLQ